MSRNPVAAVSKLLLASVTALSWLLISNHCTIISAVAATEPEDVCPMHARQPAPAKDQKAPASDQVCCKSLHATLAKPALNRVLPLLVPVLAIFSDTADCEYAEAPHTVGLCLDTGPPGAKSFSELVLQRSVLAHAPPLFA